MSAYGYNNQNPGNNFHGSGFGHGGNNITVRGSNVVEYVQSSKPSKNMVQANLKVLRLFRRACRVMPFILRTHCLYPKVSTTQAKINLSNFFKKHAHVRDSSLVDFHVDKGYEFLYEAEYQMCQNFHLFPILCPKESRVNDRGYSFLEEKQMGNKTSFLKDFYKGKNPNF